MITHPSPIILNRGFLIAWYTNTISWLCPPNTHLLLSQFLCQKRVRSICTKCSKVTCEYDTSYCCQLFPWEAILARDKVFTFEDLFALRSSTPNRWLPPVDITSSPKPPLFAVGYVIPVWIILHKKSQCDYGELLGISSSHVVDGTLPKIKLPSISRWPSTWMRRSQVRNVLVFRNTPNLFRKSITSSLLW